MSIAMRAHSHDRSLCVKCFVTQMEERIMSKLDDLEAQFVAAINTIAAELQAEVANTEGAIAARFQPFADRLTALGADPAGQVPAATGGTGAASA